MMKANTPMIECPFCMGSGRIEARSLSIGMRFKIAREAKTLTQEEAARRMGCGRPQLANLESDHGKPSFEVLVSAAELYGVTTDYLTGRATPSATAAEVAP